MLKKLRNETLISVAKGNCSTFVLSRVCLNLALASPEHSTLCSIFLSLHIHIILYIAAEVTILQCYTILKKMLCGCV